MDTWITWDFIGTFAGAVGLTTIFTQIVKSFLDRVDPKWIVLLCSLVLTLGYTISYVQDYSFQGIFLSVLNWIVVAGTAIGAYEGVLRPIAAKVGGGKS